MAILDKVGTVIGELQTWTFTTVLSAADPNGGSHHPQLSEISSLELSVFLVDSGLYTYVKAWTYAAGTWAEGVEVLKNVNIKDTGRGEYNQGTGELVVTLHAGDNPCIAPGTTPGTKELHEALVIVRYNADVDQLPKRVQFKVENLNKVPRDP